jgi:general secretion pathway protein N
MRGQGRLLKGRWQFRGEAFAEPGHEALLANLLQIIGRKQGERTILSLG